MKSLYAPILLSACLAVGQQTAPKPANQKPANSKPENSQSQSTAATYKASDSTPRKTDKASAYYHFTMAHMYEEEMAVYGRSDLMTKAIQEYRLAIEADPTSQYLTSGLAELYARTGRIRDAVSEAQEILQRDPNNLKPTACSVIFIYALWETCRAAAAPTACSSWPSSNMKRS